MSKKRIFSAEEQAFIRKEYLNIPVKPLAKKLGTSYGVLKREMDAMGLVIPKEVAESRKRLGQFVKGQESHNKGRKWEEFLDAETIEKLKKTQFKNGHTPHNTAKKNGVISVRQGYKYIRLEKGNWVMLHHHIWEEHHGPVPEGHCLWFKDQNPLNCHIDNLELITRQENMNRNVHYLPPELNRAKKLITRIHKNLELHGK